MTTTDFKEKYPHYSHLEGNELWDAMENSYLYEHKDDKPKEVTDWMGNEVKDGDEVCFIVVKRMDYFSNLALLIPDGNGGHTEIKIDTENKPEVCWEIGDYYKVFMQGTHPSISIKTGEYTFETALSLILFITDERCKILAIKDVSDNKELYLNSAKHL